MKLIVGVLAVSLSGLAAEPDPELMKKLAAHQERIGRVLKNGTMLVKTHAEELDSDGKPKSSHDALVRTTARDGKRTEEVVSATADGRDVRADVQKRRDSGEADGHRMTLEDLPFEASQQPLYQFTLGPRSADGLIEISFAPRNPGEKKLTGSARVDPVAGELVSMNARPAKLPMFVDHIDIHTECNGRVDGSRMLSRMSVAGEAGFWLVKKRFRATIDFSDVQLLK